MKRGIISGLALLTALFILVAVSAPATRAEPLTHVPPPCLHYAYLPRLLANSAGGAAVTAEQPAQALPPATDHARQPDFNGDGCVDLAISVHREDIGSVMDAGMVNVIYGGSQGLTSAHNQGWHRGGGYDVDGAYLGDIQGEVGHLDLFGKVLATGDFNDDGYTDLAVGVEFADSGGQSLSGAVQVIYGSETGLAAAGNQIWTQSGGWIDDAGDGSGVYLGDIYGGPEEGDRFGATLTVGDFNGDGYADLAIGAPYESIGDLDRAGAVNVLFGSETGLTWVGNQWLSQNDVLREDDGAGTYTLLGDLLAGSELNDFFGLSLAAGDITGDGYDELVIGVPQEDIGNVIIAGAMHIVRGSAQGLVAPNNEHWHQSGAYRDHDGDGQTDVTIGNPRGGAEPGDKFGSSLVVGNFDGDPFADVAVGVPQEALTIDGEFKSSVGVVQVFRGSADGLTLEGEQWWRQDGESTLGPMIGGLPETGDKFGSRLTTGDFDGDGIDDLAVGTPDKASSSYGDHGSVSVIYGSENGLALANHQWLTQFEVLTEGQDQGALVGVVGPQDARFGEAIMAADFNNDGYDELVVGDPEYSLPPVTYSGAVSVIRGGSEGLTVAGNQLWHQDGGLDDKDNFLGDLFGTAEYLDTFGESLP
jgi:hypothetical protein